jgi:hypothetical protein
MDGINTLEMTRKLVLSLSPQTGTVLEFFCEISSLRYIRIIRQTIN